MKTLRTLALLAGAALMLSGAALADDKHRDRHHDDDYRYSDDNRSHGFDYGYRDGHRHGHDDRIRRAGYDYKDNQWKRADRGYRDGMGSRGQYRKVYRDGYRRGYDDGYNGRNSRGGDGWPGVVYGPVTRDRDIYDDGDRGYNDRGGRGVIEVAQRNGYEEGLHYGDRDARDRRRFDPRDAKGYKDADRGYYSGLGDKGRYQDEFRRAFVRGYEQGYRR